MTVKNKIGFCILHFHAIDETVNCILSIKENIDTDNYEIVVVDNNSSNGTGEILRKKYINDEKVTIILNKENLGFARGNNVGFKYLKDKGKCNYIVMLNNDVVLKSKNIYTESIKEYKNSKFAVMGPKIYDKNNEYGQVGEFIDNPKIVKKNIFVLYFLLLLSYIRMLKIFIKLKKKTNSVINTNDGIRKENIMLHGCFWIFSPTYVKPFDGLDGRTFLYGEEDLLYIRLLKNHMTSIYNPKIVIQHLEDVATNKSEKNFYKKKIRMYKNLIYSSKIILSELKEIKDEGYEKTK